MSILRTIPSKLLGFLLTTIFRTYGIFNNGVGGRTSKDELLHGEERPLGMATSSSLFFVSHSVEDAPSVGGVLIAVTSWGQFVGVGLFLIYLTWVTTVGYLIG